jgi:transposase-like protein
MNPQEQFCPNPDCKARGKEGASNISVHSKKERRYLCKRCNKTFSETKGTPLYYLKKRANLVVLVVTLLAYGCPVQAIVAAFGLDERTVAEWLRRSGEHCQEVHEKLVGEQKLVLGQVQADEIRVKAQGETLWLAQAIMVGTRLWLGGVVGQHRDYGLIVALVAQVHKMALCRELLLAVDGLASYVTAFRQAFRVPLYTGKAGRPRLLPWPNIAIVQVIKRRIEGVLCVERRVTQGREEMIRRVLQQSQGGGVINTAYIERLNATFRQRLACLARRSRALVRTPKMLEQGMHLVGCVYNFSTPHQSLRLKLYLDAYRYRWVKRTPAMAAGLTNHCWSVREVLCFKVPPPPYEPSRPKRPERPCRGLEGLTA